MISALISRLVILVFGLLYPAYSSYKAVKTKDIKLYVKWMMYWIVFALFTAAETFTDIFISFWFPFYYELKVIMVIWLLSPVTNGSSTMYRRVIHPLFMRREQEIDELIAKAKDQGYNVILDIGCKSMSLATNAIMSTAIMNVPGTIRIPSSSTSKVGTDVVDSITNETDAADLLLLDTTMILDETDGGESDTTEVKSASPVSFVQPESTNLLNESDEEYQTPSKKTRRTTRKRDASTSSTRVTRSKNKHS